MKKENKKGGTMFGGFRTRPTFSVITLSVFVIFFVVIAIYIVYTSMASKEFGTAKNPNLDDLTVQVLSDARDYKNAKAEEKAGTKDKLKTKSTQRKAEVLKMMEQDPEGFLRVAISKDLKETLLGEVAEDIEEEVSLEGTLEVLEVDDFENEVSERAYYLVTRENKRLKVSFAKTETDVLNGAKVRLKGVALADSMVVDASSGDGLTVVEEAKDVKGASTIKKVAALLFTFSDLTTQPQTPSYIKGLIFSNSDSAKNYHNQASYYQLDIEGKVATTGDVYGWYPINVRSADGCNYHSWRDTAISEATKRYGFSTTGYTNIILIFPRVSSCTMSSGSVWAGLGQMPGTYTWINGAVSKSSTITHELGHNFGVRHASTINCTNSSGTRVPISTSCTMSEYGDPFDVMGSSSGMKHHNNFHKGKLGYLRDINRQDVSASGNYTVYQVEKAVAGVTALRVPYGKDTDGTSLFYYVEYRRPFGFDSFASTDPVVNGVTIRIGYDYGYARNTKLLDMTPGTTSFTDAALLTGRTFNDSARGIKFYVNSVDAEKASVNITVPTPTTSPCVRANPTVTVSPSGQWGTPGQSLNYNVTVKNNNSSTCGNSTFSVTPTLPAGLTMIPTSLSESLAPGASVTRTIGVSSSSTMSDGTYTFMMTARNSAATTYTASASANYNVFKPDLNPPIVTISGVTEGQTVGSKGNLKTRVSASDPSGISTIRVYFNGKLVKTCSNVTYCGYAINLGKLASGTHVLKGEAVDKDPTPQTGSAQVSFKK